MSDRVRVFAERFDGTKWKDIAYWDSLDGGASFGSPSVAVDAATIGATNGLSDPTVYYAAGDARPFKMVFGIRGASGTPTSIGLADSTDGSSWTYQGSVFTFGSDTWQTGGGNPSYVFYDDAISKWVMMLNTLDSGSPQLGYGAYATSASPSGPFGTATLIASPYSTQTGTLTGSAGSSTATTNIGALRLNEPYLVWKTGQQAAEIVTPIAQSGTSVTFDLPLFDTYSSATFAHVAATHIDPSIVWKNDDGSWGGIFTAYHALSGALCEYTVNVTAASLDGPWTITSGEVVFSPYGVGLHHINSTENPSPIVPAP